MAGLANETAAEKIIQESTTALWSVFHEGPLALIENKEAITPVSGNKDEASVNAPVIKDVVVIQKQESVGQIGPEVSGDKMEAAVARDVHTSSSSSEPPHFDPFRPAMSLLANSVSLSQDIAAIKAKPPTVREMDAVSPVMVKVVRSFLLKSETNVEESIVPLAVDLTTEIMMNDTLRTLMLDDVISEVVNNYAALEQRDMQKRQPSAVINLCSGTTYQPTEAELQWDAIKQQYPCALCCDVLAASTVLECSHSFCWACIDEMRQENASLDPTVLMVYDCPSCKTGFTRNYFEPVVDRAVEALVAAYPWEDYRKQDYQERREKYFKNERKLEDKRRAKEAKRLQREKAAAAAATTTAGATGGEGSQEAPLEPHWLEQLNGVIIVSAVLMVVLFVASRRVRSK